MNSTPSLNTAIHEHPNFTENLETTSLEVVYSQLESDTAGLSSQIASARLQQFSRNELEEKQE